MTALDVAYLFMGLSLGVCLTTLGVAVFALVAARRFYRKAMALARHRCTPAGKTPTVEDVNRMIADVERFTRGHDQW